MDAEARDVELLRAMNLKIAEWEQRRDADAVEQLDSTIAESLVFRRADGNVVGKAEFMQALQGPSPFLERSSRDVSVQVRGDRAFVVLTVVATKPDASTGFYRNVRVFFRHDPTWLLEAWFNDDVTNVTGLH
jgi:Domain of unknown function (DUF4440)